MTSNPDLFSVREFPISTSAALFIVDRLMFSLSLFSFETGIQ